MWAYTFILTTTLCLKAIMWYYIYRQHLIRQDRKNDFLHVISSNVGRNSLNNRPLISLQWHFSYVWPLIHWLSYSYSSNYIVSNCVYFKTYIGQAICFYQLLPSLKISSNNNNNNNDDNLNNICTYPTFHCPLKPFITCGMHSSKTGRKLGDGWI